MKKTKQKYKIGDQVDAPMCGYGEFIIESAEWEDNAWFYRFVGKPGKVDQIYIRKRTHRADKAHPFILIGVLMVGGHSCNFPARSVQVLKSTTDERGLTSVLFIQKGDTLALDYLTKKELDSLTNIK